MGKTKKNCGGGEPPSDFDKLFQIFPLWTLGLVTPLIPISMYVLKIVFSSFDVFHTLIFDLLLSVNYFILNGLIADSQASPYRSQGPTQPRIDCKPHASSPTAYCSLLLGRYYSAAHLLNLQ